MTNLFYISYFSILLVLRIMTSLFIYSGSDNYDSCHSFYLSYNILVCIRRLTAQGFHLIHSIKQIVLQHRYHPPKVWILRSIITLTVLY